MLTLGCVCVYLYLYTCISICLYLYLPSLLTWRRFPPGKIFIALSIFLNLSLYIIMDSWRTFFLFMYVFLFLESFTAGYHRVAGKLKVEPNFWYHRQVVLIKLLLKLLCQGAKFPSIPSPSVSSSIPLPLLLFIIYWFFF